MLVVLVSDQWVRGVARRAGEVVEVTPSEGAGLCAAGLAVPARRRVEMATLRAPERAVRDGLIEGDFASRSERILRSK